MQKERTNNIFCITVAKYASMHIEADTIEEALKYAKKHCDEVPDSAFDDSEVEVDSYEPTPWEAQEWMDQIWIEDGETISYSDYIDSLEEQD